MSGFPQQNVPKKTGMPIKEIKTFIDRCIQGDATIPSRLTLIDGRRNAVEQQIEDLKAILNHNTNPHQKRVMCIKQ